MVALNRELVEELQQLTEDQQRKVLDFVRSLDKQKAEADWEHQAWTPEEVREMLKPNPRTGAELVAWLNENPPPTPWGNLQPDEDSATYVHNQRRQQDTILEDPDDPRHD